MGRGLHSPSSVPVSKICGGPIYFSFAGGGCFIKRPRVKDAKSTVGRVAIDTGWSVWLFSCYQT